MPDLNNLDLLYTYLEDHAQDYKYPRQIGLLFRKVREYCESEGRSDNAKQAQWEVDFFHVRLEGGKPACARLRCDASGKVKPYPECESLNADQIAYLIRRLESTGNPILRARYGHILWHSRSKHERFAHASVDAYVDLIAIYEDKDKQLPAEHWGLDLLDAVVNAWMIACEAKYRVDEIKQEFIRLVREFNPQSTSSFALRGSIIEVMLTDKRRILKGDFTKFQDVCWCMASSLERGNNIHGAIDALGIGEKVDLRVGCETYPWSQRRGELYEGLVAARGKGDSAAPEFCLSAIESYHQAGDVKKVADLERTYEELKRDVKLDEIGFEVDLTETRKRSAHFAEKLVGDGSEAVIAFLVYGKGLLPSCAGLKKGSQEDARKYVFRQFAPTMVLDSRGNISQHFGDVDEKDYLGVLETYGLHAKVWMRIYLADILLTAIREGKLDSAVILDWLSTSSWLGRPLSLQLPNGTTTNYNWLSLVAPSVLEYFSQVEWWMTNPCNYPNLILAIDSITMKIEGILRDMHRLIGVVTTHQKRDRKGRTIVWEKDINRLLYEEPLKKVLNEDDLLFLRFLLVEKMGYNLRHKVAHALMLPNEYTIDYMHFLLLALLRLAKCDPLGEGSKVIGHAGRKVFHRTTCRMVALVDRKELIEFESKQQAMATGRRPCKLCGG